MDDEDTFGEPGRLIIKNVESEFEAVQRTGWHPKTRTIFVDGMIGEDWGASFQQMMWWLERGENHEPVTIYLQTPGGDTQSMYEFYDVVTSSPCEVTIIGHGQVCSAGVLMLVCGDVRYVMENCVLMSHEASGFGAEAGLRHSEAKERRKWEDWTVSQWNVLMARHTPHDAAFWKSITGRKAELWKLGAYEIVQQGLADAVLDPHSKLKKFFPKVEDD